MFDFEGIDGEERGPTGSTLLSEEDLTFIHGTQTTKLPQPTVSSGPSSAEGDADALRGSAQNIEEDELPGVVDEEPVTSKGCAVASAPTLGQRAAALTSRLKNEARTPQRQEIKSSAGGADEQGQEAIADGGSGTVQDDTPAKSDAAPRPGTDRYRAWTARGCQAPERQHALEAWKASRASGASAATAADVPELSFMVGDEVLTMQWDVKELAGSVDEAGGSVDQAASHSPVVHVEDVTALWESWGVQYARRLRFSLMSNDVATRGPPLNSHQDPLPWSPAVIALHGAKSILLTLAPELRRRRAGLLGNSSSMQVAPAAASSAQSPMQHLVPVPLTSDQELRRAAVRGTRSMPREQYNIMQQESRRRLREQLASGPTYRKKDGLLDFTDSAG